MILITGGSHQGKMAYAEQVKKENQVNEIIDLNPIVRDWSSEGKVAADEALYLLEEHPDATFVLTEVGCGLVPIDADERLYRENCGRAGCVIAEHAKDVYRMVCGIPQKIK